MAQQTHTASLQEAGHGPGAFRLGKSIMVAVLFLLALTQTAFASDPVGIWAVVDKVVLEPSAEKPERIQIWGTFSLAEGRGITYQSPESGYLYYELPKDNPEAAQKQWKDLKEMAGKMQAVGFGHRYDKEKITIRQATQKPEKPNLFHSGFGLVKFEKAPNDYAPVQRLLEAAKSKKTQG